MSISLDRLAQGVQKAERETLPKMDALDTIVCSIGHKQLIKEKAKVRFFCNFIIIIMNLT